MNDEIKVELLKIALQLSLATLQGKIKTPSNPHPATSLHDITLVFSDCVKAVQEQFSQLASQ